MRLQVHDMFGKFDLVENPTRFEQNRLGVWEIRTEDETEFIPVPALASFYHMKVREAVKLQNSQEKIIQDVIESEHEQPAVPPSVIEYAGARHEFRHCLLVACDGSHDKYSQKWGVGVVFLKTGNCLHFGGSFQSPERFFVNPYISSTMIQSSFIELLALFYSLQASFQIGLRWRREAFAKNVYGWAGMAGHLVVVVDTLTSVNNILMLAVDGYFRVEYVNPLLDGQEKQCAEQELLYAIVSILSYAVAVFERVTFVHRNKLPSLYWKDGGMGEWQTGAWFPDQLAKSARDCREDTVDLSDIRKNRWVEFAVKNKEVVANQLHLVVFSYDWRG